MNDLIIDLISFGYVALSLGLLATPVPILNGFRRLFRAAGVDLIELYARWERAKIDTESNRAALEAKTEATRIRLDRLESTAQESRAKMKLLGGGR